MVFLIWYLISSGKFDYKNLSIFFSFQGFLQIGAIIAALFLSHILFSIRYGIFIKVLGFFPRFKSVFTIIMIGVFYNNFLPGGTGGDILRIYYLKKKEDVPLGIGAAVTLIDRIVGLLGLVLVTLISMFFVSIIYDNVLKDYSFAIFIAVTVPILITLFLIMLRNGKFYSFIEKILSRLFFAKYSIMVINTFRTVVKSTSSLVKSLILCSTGHIITISCISFLAYLLIGFEGALVAVSMSGAILLTTVVPVTPGNIGVTETLAGAVFMLFGVEGGATVFAMWRVVTVLFSITGGVFYLVEGGKKLSDEAKIMQQ